MPPVTILTSAVGLGVYIPALLIRQQLLGENVVAEVEVLEDFYPPERQQSHIAHGQAHHANFALAQLAHRMARDVQECLDGERLQILLKQWAAQGCRHFIVWSGFWLPVLERYRVLTGWDLDIDHCRIDAEMSASFKVHTALVEKGREIWLWHGDAERLVHEIPVTTLPPVPFLERQSRLMVHGGGWGIGTYQERAEALARAGFALDLVVHDASEAKALRKRDRAFQLKPGWQAWQRNGAGQLEFPPMRQLGESELTLGARDGQHHALYEVIRHNLAIISKPGGCSLIDSLASATPLVLLEPYGYAEARNSEIWQRLGFGIRYEDWRDTGYDIAVLARLHQKLIGHLARGIDYPRVYAARLQQGLFS